MQVYKQLCILVKSRSNIVEIINALTKILTLKFDFFLNYLPLP